MNPELKRQIEHLEGLTSLHLKVSAEMFQADGGRFFPVDILAAATIKRSLALVQGFTTLVRMQNYTCAASLLRLQLDSCLRFFAAFIVNDPHKLAHEVLKGKPIRDAKDRNGNRMTDRYLVETLGKKYEWMPRVYESTSGFIHLSEKHMFSIFTTSKSDDAKFSMLLSATDSDIPDDLWIELTLGFLVTTDALFEYLKGWVATKINPELAERAREEIKTLTNRS